MWNPVRPLVTSDTREIRADIFNDDIIPRLELLADQLRGAARDWRPTSIRTGATASGGAQLVVFLEAIPHAVEDVAGTVSDLTDEPINPGKFGSSTGTPFPYGLPNMTHGEAHSAQFAGVKAAGLGVKLPEEDERYQGLCPYQTIEAVCVLEAMHDGDHDMRRPEDRVDVSVGVGAKTLWGTGAPSLDEKWQAAAQGRLIAAARDLPHDVVSVLLDVIDRYKVIQAAMDTKPGPTTFTLWVSAIGEHATNLRRAWEDGQTGGSLPVWMMARVLTFAAEMRRRG